MTDLIPGARVLSIDHGGHLLLGDHPEIGTEVTDLPEVSRLRPRPESAAAAKRQDR